MRQNYFDDDVDDDEDDWVFYVPIPPQPSRGEKRSHDDVDADEMREAGADEALFAFDMRLGEMPRRWKNVVHKTRHSAQLRQARDVRDGDRLGEEMVEAVR